MKGCRLRVAALLTLTLLCFPGCRGSREGRRQEPLRIAAAASLQGPLGELKAEYEHGRPDLRLAVTYAGSSTLRVQISEGAPYDLFISADLDQPMRLYEQGDALVPQVFVFNSLIFAVPAGSSVANLSMLRPGRFGSVVPDVPLGRYTEKMLQCLQLDPQFGAGVVQIFRENIVTREPNAAALRTRLELGELDGAFLYATDVRGSRTLRGLKLPGRCDDRLPYAAAVITRSRRRDEAAAFAAFLLSEPAAVILDRHGFKRSRRTAVTGAAGHGNAP